MKVKGRVSHEARG